MNNLITIMLSPEDAKALMQTVGMLNQQRIRNMYTKDVNAYGQAITEKFNKGEFSATACADVTGALYSKLYEYFDNPTAGAMDQKDERIAVFRM